MYTFRLKQHVPRCIPLVHNSTPPTHQGPLSQAHKNVFTRRIEFEYKCAHNTKNRNYFLYICIKNIIIKQYVNFFDI